MVGKTTTPEFAYSSFTESPLWGVTRNPWNPDAHARRLLRRLRRGRRRAAACRWPKAPTWAARCASRPAFCGIVGLKPSFGPHPLHHPAERVRQHLAFRPAGAHHRRRRGCSCDVTQGPDDRDIQSLKPQARPRRIRSRRSISGWRLALCVDLGCFYVDPEVEAAVRAAAEALKSQGAVVEEVELCPGRAAMADAWVESLAGLLAALLRPQAGEVPRQDGPQCGGADRGGLPHVRRRLQAASRSSAPRWWRKLHRRSWQRYDALLCPTMARDGAAGRRQDTDLLQGTRRRALSRARHDVGQFNLFGLCPALSVPGRLVEERPAHRPADRRPALRRSRRWASARRWRWCGPGPQAAADLVKAEVWDIR